MPFLSTFSAGSAKRFGLTGISKKLVLTTATFTTNGTWVAPAGVTSVATASGKGGDGSPTYGSSSFTFNANQGFGSSAPFAQWGDLYSAAVATQSALASRVGTYGPSGFIGAYGIRVGSDNKWSVIYQSTDDLSGAIIDSVSSVYAGSGSPQTSGNITYSGLSFSAWNVNASYHFPGFLAASATALGQTFPGGNGGPAGTTTFTNVAVTPGTSYSIVVPGGGLVTLQYFV